MRLIDADALKKAITEHCRSEVECLNHFWYDENIVALIDNAPTVDLVSPTIKVNIPEEAKQKLIEELQKPHKLLVLPEPEVAFERPQGECEYCKHFQKSLCENSPYGWCSIRRATQEGDLETQVPKDYYCSWFEKDGADMRGAE